MHLHDAPVVVLRVGWADSSLGWLAARSIARLSATAVVEPFASHQALLDADAQRAYDVVVLNAKDQLNAMDTRDRLRERGHVLAVALCSGCSCSGGIKGGHGVFPETFDAYFEKMNLDWRTVALWLDDLAAHPSLEGST